MASTKADASKISLPDFTANAEFWPVLPPLEAWQDTRDTVHMWTQIVGKVRLALNPLINHWWEVPLYVSPRGLATSSIPYARGIFEVEFDFLADHVLIQTSEGAGKSLSLRPRSVADFYKEFMAALASLGMTVKIRTPRTRARRSRFYYPRSVFSRGDQRRILARRRRHQRSGFLRLRCARAAGFRRSFRAPGERFLSSADARIHSYVRRCAPECLAKDNI